jgi:hypothetical protein
MIQLQWALSVQWLSNPFFLIFIIQYLILLFPYPSHVPPAAHVMYVTSYHLAASLYQEHS